jgi:anti-sigma B factor antagonist
MSTAQNVFETEIHEGVLVVVPTSDQIGLRHGRLQEQTDRVTQTIEQGDVRGVVVDAGNMSYLPSAVISAFIQIWEAAVEHGGSFVTCNLSDDALQSLIVTRLDTRWPTYDSRDEALAAVSQ